MAGSGPNFFGFLSKILLIVLANFGQSDRPLGGGGDRFLKSGCSAGLDDPQEEPEEVFEPNHRKDDHCLSLSKANFVAANGKKNCHIFFRGFLI